MRIVLDIEEGDIERIVRSLNNQHAYTRSRDLEDTGHKGLADLYRRLTSADDNVLRGPSSSFFFAFFLSLTSFEYCKGDVTSGTALIARRCLSGLLVSLSHLQSSTEARLEQRRYPRCAARVPFPANQV